MIRQQRFYKTHKAATTAAAAAEQVAAARARACALSGWNVKRPPLRQVEFIPIIKRSPVRRSAALSLVYTTSFAFSLDCTLLGNEIVRGTKDWEARTHIFESGRKLKYPSEGNEKRY